MRKFIKRLIQYTKIAELDAGEINILFCFDFVGESFGKAFDDPCEDIIDFEHWHFMRV